MKVFAFNTTTGAFYSPAQYTLISGTFQLTASVNLH